MAGALFLTPAVASAFSIHDIPVVGSIVDFLSHRGPHSKDDHKGPPHDGDSRGSRGGHGGRGESGGPKILPHADIFVQASTTPIVVNYSTPLASDRRTHVPVDVSCDPPSRSPFTVGRHVVICTAANGSGTSHSRFRITVSTAPFDHYIVLDYSGSVGGVADGSGGYAITATSSSGAFITYTATLMDRRGVDHDGSVTCTPAPGYFTVGITTISCTALDGNHKIIMVEDSGDITVSDLPTCTSAANSCGMISTGVVDGGICTAVMPSNSSCNLGSNGSPALGGGGGGGAGVQSGAYNPKGSIYTPPRPQIIYPDGRVVYLDTESGARTTAGSQSGSGNTPGFQFTLGIKPGSGSSGSTGAGATGSEVKQLQIFLNNHGFSVSKSGAGSKGKEGTYFGPGTKAALIKFQEANAKDILVPLGLKKGTGVMGPSTRKFINSLLQKGK